MEKLVVRYDRQLQRILEFIPGLITWTVLTSPIWLGRKYPSVLIFFLTFLAIYWVYRAFIHTIGTLVGYKRYKREMVVDWLKQCQELDFAKLPDPQDLPPKFSDLKQLILIPAVNEGMSVLENTFQGLAQAQYPKENLFVAVSIEERGASEVIPRLEEIKKKYGPAIGELLVYVHPKGTPGEAIGAAAANRTWGGRHAVEELQKRGIDLRHVFFTTFDADCRVHPQFLARATYQFLTAKNRREKFYQTAVYLFDNNIWEVPPLMRVQANGVTLAVLSSWVVDADRKDTWSCYSVPLTTVLEANFWDVTLGVDDTTFFWEAFLAKEGKFSGEGFYIPIYSDAVQGETVFKSHVSQYKQLVRWGWGVLVFPLAVKGFLQKNKIPFSAKIIRLLYMIEQYSIWQTITFLITFGFALFLATNPLARQHSMSYMLPRTTSVMLTLAFIFLLPVTWVREKITVPKPKEWSTWKRLGTWAEAPLIIVNLLTYCFIPYLDAETRFMLGKKMKDLYFTPKHRK